MDAGGKGFASSLWGTSLCKVRCPLEDKVEKGCDNESVARALSVVITCLLGSEGEETHMCTNPIQMWVG